MRRNAWTIRKANKIKGFIHSVGNLWIKAYHDGQFSPPTEKFILNYIKLIILTLCIHTKISLTKFGVTGIVIALHLMRAIYITLRGF